MHQILLQGLHPDLVGVPTFWVRVSGQRPGVCFDPQQSLENDHQQAANHSQALRSDPPHLLVDDHHHLHACRSYAVYHRDGLALRELLASPPAVTRLAALLGGPHGGAPPLIPGPFW
jgi:hypothetical protein